MDARRPGLPYQWFLSLHCDAKVGNPDDISKVSKPPFPKWPFRNYDEGTPIGGPFFGAFSEATLYLPSAMPDEISFVCCHIVLFSDRYRFV